MKGLSAPALAESSAGGRDGSAEPEVWRQSPPVPGQEAVYPPSRRLCFRLVFMAAGCLLQLQVSQSHKDVCSGRAQLAG